MSQESIMTLRSDFRASDSGRTDRLTELNHIMRLTALTILLMILSITLQGCVTNAPKKETTPAGKAPIAVAPEVRAEFDAAMALLKAEEYEKGIEMMNKVVAQSQNNPVPYINLAIAHAKLGQLDKAEENLKSALKLEPENPVANNEYGIIYRKTGRFAEARTLYEQLLAKYPYYPLVHKNLGILCDLYLRDYECALKEYEFYSSAMPEDKNAKIWIADVQRRLGK